MPRLSKVRIAGLHYDDFKKKHEDSIFDFTSDEEARHALFTLQNGGGKGVLMQCFAQALMPGISWGGKDGNKVEGFFYQNGRLIPYTFHVMLEWLLDTEPRTSLWTGICITIEQKVTEDEEDTIGLKYFAYSAQKERTLIHSFESIPLYDKKKQQGMTYDEFENFIKKNNKYFTFYSKSDMRGYQSRYVEMLKSNHIYPDEWKTLKEINRMEGGVEEYFKNAVTNRKLFENKMIPIITENLQMQNPDESHALGDIFASCVKIAHNLPILLQRYEDYSLIQESLIPLSQLMEKGISRKQREDKLLQKGHNLCLTFQKGLDYYQQEIMKWESEKNKTQEEQKNIQYEQKNIEYTRHYNTLIQWEKEQEEIQKEEIDLENHRKQIKRKLHEYEITEKVLILQEEQFQRDNKEKELQQLQDTLAHTEIKDEIEKLENQIKEEWNTKRNEIQKIVDGYLGYQYYLNQNRKENEIKTRKIRDTRESLQNEVSKYENRVDYLKSQKQKLLKWYDFLKVEMLHILVEEEKENEKQLNDTLSKSEKGLVNLRKDKEKHDQQFLQITMEMEGLTLKQKDLQQQYEIRNQEEVEIQKIIYELCHVEEVPYSKQWLSTMEPMIKKEIREKRAQQKKLNEEQWKIQLDYSINQRDYWIPNTDVIKMKEEIENLGIKVQLGMEYLQSKKEEAKVLMEQNPWIPFSVVIRTEKDLEILQNINLPYIQRSPVPIYVIQQKQPVIPMVKGKEQGFVYAEQYVKWKEELLDQLTQYEIAVNRLSDKEKRLQDLDYLVYQLLEKQSSQELQIEIESNKQKEQLLQVSLNQIKEKQKEILQKIEDIEKKIDDIRQKLQDCIRRKEKVEELYEEEKQLEQQKIKIKQIKNQIKELKEQETSLLDETRHIDEVRMNNRLEHESWIQQGQAFIINLKEIIKQAALPKATMNIEISNPPTYFSWMALDLVQIYQRWSSLNLSVEQQNSRIQLLRENIKEIDEKIQNTEKSLEILDSKWKSIPIEVTQESQLYLLQRNDKDQLDRIQNQIEKLKVTIGTVKQNIVNEEENIKKLSQIIFDSFNKMPQAKEDELDVLEYRLKNEYKEKARYKEESESIIKQNIDKREHLQMLLKWLQKEEALEEAKGIVEKSILKEESFEAAYDQWDKEMKSIKKLILAQFNEVKDVVSHIKNEIQVELQEQIIKDQIIKQLDEMSYSHYEENLSMIQSIIEWCKHEKESHEEEKNEAERARARWVQRAMRQVLTISDSIKEMIRKMQIKNSRGENFPLVRLKNPDHLPKEEDAEGIKLRLEDYFLECIQKMVEENINMEAIPKKTLDKMMNDAVIFSRALRSDYPELQVYKMTERKEFLYESPQSRHYVSWQAIQKGEGYTPQGSGGQTLSINTFMMMMLMNYRKKPLYGVTPWTVLIMDNPFGKASDDHVLEPIFSIADALNFQIIAFAAPNIIKPEISERFPVFWNLKIALNKAEGQIGSVVSKVTYGGRIWK